MAAGPTPDFQQVLSELESLIERLEEGDLPLEEALATFERGVELTRQCQSALQSAQQRVEILLERNGQTEALPFEPEPLGAGETGDSAAR